MMSFEEKLLDDIFNSKFNFELHNKIGIHTYEIYLRMCRELFIPIFEHVKSYVFQRSKTNHHFLILYKDYFEHANVYTVFAKWTTNIFIEIEPGVSIKLGVYGEIAHVHMVFNPILVVEANSKHFIASEYDYTQITPHDFRKWREFDQLSRAILSRWHIPNSKMDKISLTRIDTCVNIDLLDVTVSDLLEYFRLVNKRCGYEVYKFKNSDHDDHHVLVYTGKLKLSIYDKTEEQRAKFDRNYRGNILRIEVQLEGDKILKEFSKFTDIYANAIHKGYNIVDIVFEAAQYAPLIIYDAIDSVFPDGNFHTRKDAIQILSEANIRESTKNRCIDFVDSLSRITTYEGISNKINQFRESTSDNVYRMILRTLEKYDIEPYWLKANSQYNLLPGLKSVYASAIRNSYEELNYIGYILEYINRYYKKDE